LTITFGSEKKVDASDSTNTTVVHYVTVKQDNKDWEAADKLYNGKNGTTYAHAEFLFQRTDGTVVGYYLVRDNGDLHYYKLAGIQLWEEGTDGDKAYQLTFQTKTKVENPTIKFAHASNASADYVVAGTSGYVYINKDDPSNPHYYLIAQADYSIGEGDNEVKYSIPIRVYLDDGWSKNWTFTVGTDGNPVFYYEKVLGAGETTTRLVDKLVLSEKVDTSVYNSFEYDLTVTLDSIQVVIDENGTYLPTAVNSDKTWTYSATVSADDNSTVTWAKKS
jgi:hypothetical protein